MYWWVRVKFLLLRSGQVRSAIFGLGLAFENFPLKSRIFSNFFPYGKKNLIRSGQSQAGLLFTATQKYAWVRSGPTSNWMSCKNSELCQLLQSAINQILFAKPSPGQKWVSRMGRYIPWSYLGQYFTFYRSKNCVGSGRAITHWHYIHRLRLLSNFGFTNSWILSAQVGQLLISLIL